MSRLGWGLLFYGASAVAVGGTLHAGWLTGQQVALFILGAAASTVAAVAVLGIGGYMAVDAINHPRPKPPPRRLKSRPRRPKRRRLPRSRPRPKPVRKRPPRRPRSRAVPVRPEKVTSLRKSR